MAIMYTRVMARYIRGWKKHPGYENYLLDKGQIPTICVVIPARNEESNIGACLDAICAQTVFPNRIIVVDDASDDSTAEIAKSYAQVSYLSLQEHPRFQSTLSTKKLAIEYAISLSEEDLIVCTDADCIPNISWLETMIICYQKSTKRFLTGPVFFHPSAKDFINFQALDFMGMMGVTAAGLLHKDILLANGANMLYERTLFHELGGYEGLDHIASGDDILLLKKVYNKNPNWAGFAKHPEAYVWTQAPKNWNALINQRVRWSGKMKKAGNSRTLMDMIIVFFVCLSLLLYPIFLIGVFSTQHLPTALGFFTPWAVLLALKLFFDHSLLYQTTHYFKQSALMRYFYKAQAWHLIYIVVIGFITNVRSSYRWKGRNIRHLTSSEAQDQ